MSISPRLLPVIAAVTLAVFLVVLGLRPVTPVPPAKSVPSIEPVPEGHPMVPLITLTDPRHVPGPQAWRYLEPSDRLIGVESGGEAAAYPFRILSWHETVNDRVGELPILVTWCNRCGTAMVFRRQVDGRTEMFRSRGQVWQQNGLLSDDRTGTLWAQATGEVIQGELQGRSLELVPFSTTSWEEWFRAHPATRVLSNDQGLLPPEAYAQGMRVSPLIPTVAEELRHVESNSLTAQVRVLGVVVNGSARAYRLEDLVAGPERFQDRVGAVTVELRFNARTEELSVVTQDGRRLQALPSYETAWRTFHPGTSFYERMPATHR